MQRLFMPELVADGLAKGGCSVEGFLEQRPAAALLCLSDGSRIPVPVDGSTPPGWICRPLRRLGAEPRYVRGVAGRGLDVVVENPYFGLEGPRGSEALPPYPVRDMNDLRMAYRNSEVGGILRRFRDDGRVPPGVEDVVAGVERDMACRGLGIDPAALTDESLLRHSAALRAEAVRRAIPPTAA